MYTVETLSETPWFDLELFLNVSQERRLGGEVLERMENLWEEWLPELSVKTINTGKIRYLLVSLGEKVEETVDRMWRDSPSTSYLYNALAQTMCMAAVQDAVPEIEFAGCAPSPRPTQALREALEAEGVPYSSETGTVLSRRYAVITYYPFKGGCEICNLQKDCPKGQGAGQEASVVLPGYER